MFDKRKSCYKKKGKNEICSKDVECKNNMKCARDGTWKRCKVMGSCNDDSVCEAGSYCNSKHKFCLEKIKNFKAGCDQDSKTSCVDKNYYCGWAETRDKVIKEACIPVQTKFDNLPTVYV